MSRCTSCGHGIIWARTRGGKAMPVNAEEDPGGNVVLTDEVDERGRLLVDVFASPQQAPLGSRLHRSHFSTCPHAGSWRT